MASTAPMITAMRPSVQMNGSAAMKPYQQDDP